jgi:3-oxoadipate enol-lactonase
MRVESQNTLELTEFVLERKGCPLHYWEGGRQGQPLIVFTHGACVDHHSFDPHVPVVAQKYRLLVWDVRGHGLSQPMGEPLTISLAVEDLLAIMDRLSYRQAVLVGHSNGAYIAQELAFRYPDQVRALVIADGTCITWKRSVFDQWILKESGDLMALMPYETLKKAGLPYISAIKEVRDYTYAAYSMLSKKDFLTIWRGVTDCLHYEPGYYIAQPLLLVHGDQDKTGDIRKIAPLWAAREPNCEYAVIPNARHFAILDNPGRFNELLMGFLGKNV